MNISMMNQRIMIQKLLVMTDDMPKISPHICRHTYCTNMARSGMNPKTLQYLMGRSDISVTMNTYTPRSHGRSIFAWRDDGGAGIIVGA